MSTKGAIHRRTLEAAKHPLGSEERARLNLSSLTSEYYPSKRYELITENGRKTLYRTRAEAVAALERL